MELTKAERADAILSRFMLLLMPLHLYLSFLNVEYSIYKAYGGSFPMRSYVLIGVYLLAVLTADVFMVWHRKLEVAVVLRKYWGSAFIAAIIVMLLHALVPEGSMVAMLCLLYTPFVVLAPFLEVLGAPVYGAASMFSVAGTGAFCLLNWAVCKFAVRGQ